MTEAWIHDADPAELWNLGPRLDVDRAWAPRPIEDLYRIPIGVDETGEPVELDFKEPALDGLGPHGLIVGSPGSGKPEFLRSTVLGLMATHSPADLNFVLTGYHSAATFGDFEGAPHVSAFVPDPGPDQLVRLQDSLEAELSRRRELLSGAGAKNYREYRQLRHAGDQRCTAPLPALFVVIDEFARTLEEKPDFAAVLVKIGRMGRALDVHMLLASYRLQRGDLRALEGFLTYRVALRTFTADESHMAIGSTDAYDLPHGTGLGYLCRVPSTNQKFKAVSSRHGDSENALFAETLDAMRGKTPAARQILTPPRQETPPPSADLWSLESGFDVDHAWAPRSAEGLYRIPVGVGEAGDPFELDFKERALGGFGPHGLIIGASGSGRGSLLRSIVTGLVTTHSPSDVNLVLAEYIGSPTFGDFANAPHVSAFAPDLESDRNLLRRLRDSLEVESSRRMELLRAVGAKNFQAYRQMQESGDPRCQEPLPALFVVIDRFLSVLDEQPDFVEILVRIARLGRSLGVHMLLASHRLERGDLRALEPFLSFHVALRTFDAQESRMAIGIPDACGITAGTGRGYLRTPDGIEQFKTAFVPDGDSENGPLATALAAMRDKASPARQILPPEAPPNLAAELWNLGQGFRIDRAWAPRPIEDLHRIPIGVDEAGNPFELDFKEAELGGIGPHGLIIGATGSGKSELLRTIVLGLMATHPPTDVNFVLADHLGGATFAEFKNAPHVSATIPALIAEPELLGRFRDSLAGELSRRSELLRTAGANTIWDYRQMRESGDQRCPEPLPMLFVVLEDFDGMLTHQPDLVEMLVMIGRLGRSLGVRMLLSSQRVDDARLRPLDGMLSYRVALRTFSAAESRAAIGVPDAYDLPPEPGIGYLRTSDGIKRFKTAYVSGVPEASLAATTLAEMRGKAPSAHQIWLPPLAEPPTLDALLPPLQHDDVRGYAAVRGPAGPLQVPMGLLDDPYSRRQDPMVLDLDTHGAIVGQGGSGKSTAMCTLIASLALAHTPREVQFYCVDLGGGSLAALRDLPHVGSVVTEPDVDAVRRTMFELDALLARRQQLFHQLGIQSMAELRDRRLRGEPDPDPYGDAFLLIDGWEELRAAFPEMDVHVRELAEKGLPLGIHVLVAAKRWAAIRPGLRNLLQTRIELRLSDSDQSEIGAEHAARVPQRRPGRGMHPSKQHFLTALPRVDGAKLNALVEADRKNGRWPRPAQEVYRESHADAVADLVDRVRSGWRGYPAPPVRLLPTELPYRFPPANDPKQIPLGIGEKALQPVHLDFRREPHFYAIGERGSGRTTLLRTIIRGITERYSPQEALIMLVDYRRTLLGFLTTEHLAAYVITPDQLRSHVEDVIPALRKRMPGPHVTQEQVRNRSWWSGPDLFIVIDDYELVTSGGENPLAPLAEFLPMAADLGLHVVLTRDSAGATRGMFERFTLTLRETNAPAMAMSANADAGRLIGVTPSRPLPPGRGTLVSRLDGSQLIQTPLVP
ncbi:type VII secretion protein EccCb [Saccharopolyspora shandongensis]|uniref:type VII secretion protein EccCb n=1 Tax=Saccharopolyspora shandongensis TaxID=418495 RepID=UPI0033F30152